MSRVRWTRPATRDLTHICDYISEHKSGEAARRMALALFEAVSSLDRFPHRARPGRKAGTRELVLPGLPYLIIFRIRDGVAEVLRILHGAQKLP